MKLNAKDFKFKMVVDNDYWFTVSGESKQVLTDEYAEQSMIEVNKVVYSPKDDMMGVERLFPFNYDVIVVENKQLKDLIKNLVYEIAGGDKN